MCIRARWFGRRDGPESGHDPDSGLDPDAGPVLWRTEVRVHHHDDLEELDDPTLVSPGTYGGILTPPSTAAGIVYAATVDAATELPPGETAYFGAPLGTEAGAAHDFHDDR